MSSRVIDKILPQQYKEVTAQQAAVYRSILPNDIKIIEVGEVAQQEMPASIPTIEAIIDEPTVNDEPIVENEPVTISEDELKGEDATPLTIEEVFGETNA